MSSIVPSELMGKAVFSKKRLSKTFEGEIVDYFKTVVGHVFVIKKNGNEFYIPYTFISKVTDDRVILAKGVKPFANKFWEEDFTSFVPSIQRVPIGKILGVEKINEEPALLIELKFALPKFIEKVWHQIKPQIKKRKPNYLKFMESKGYLYPLCYHPRAVAEVAQHYNVKIPDELFTKRVYLPLKEGKIITNQQIDFPKNPTILKSEIEKPTFYSLEPPEMDIPTFFKFRNLEPKINKLKEKLQKYDFKIKQRDYEIEIMLDKWYTMYIEPKKVEDLLVWHIRFSVDKRALADTIRGIDLMPVLLFGLIGLMYAMSKQAGKLPPDRLLEFLDDPLKYEPAQKALEIVRSTIK